MLPRNVESISTMAPAGTKDQLRARAAMERTSVPALLRQIIAGALSIPPRVQH